MDADDRPSSNSKFSSRRKIKYSRHSDTTPDHALMAGVPPAQVRDAGRLLEPHSAHPADRDHQPRCHPHQTGLDQARQRVAQHGASKVTQGDTTTPDPGRTPSTQPRQRRPHRPGVQSHRQRPRQPRRHAGVQRQTPQVVRRHRQHGDTNHRHQHLSQTRGCSPTHQRAAHLGGHRATVRSSSAYAWATGASRSSNGSGTVPMGRSSHVRSRPRVGVPAPPEAAYCMTSSPSRGAHHPLPARHPPWLTVGQPRGHRRGRPRRGSASPRPDPGRGPSSSSSAVARRGKTPAAPCSTPASRGPRHRSVSRTRRHAPRP